MMTGCLFLGRGVVAQVAEAAAATREEEREARMNKSPSDFSCQSYEMFVGGQGAPPEGRSSLAGGGGPGGGNGHDGDYSIREKMSIKSDDVDSLLGGGNVSDSRMKINGRVRKVKFHPSDVCPAASLIFFLIIILGQPESTWIAVCDAPGVQG